MPESAAAIDASPLILLSRIDRLDLLLALRRRLVVPAPVREELRAKGPHDPAATAVEQAAYLEPVPSPPLAESIRLWNLGKGESAVLAWANQHPGTVALLDDLRARRCAESHGVPLLGTAGLVLLAKRRGAIVAAAPLLRALVTNGMHLSAPILAELLRRAGD